MAPPGIAILDDVNYWDLPSIFSMQSTNSQYSSKGSICIGRLLKIEGSRKRNKRFKDRITPNDNSWKTGHRLQCQTKRQRKLPQSKKSMLHALGLPKVQQRVLNNPATILICRPNPTILTQQDIDYDKGDIFEYLQLEDNDTSQSTFVELNNRQTYYINLVFADYSNHLPPDGYNMITFL